MAQSARQAFRVQGGGTESSEKKSCTGFTVLNPAYQNPDCRGRAGVTHGDRDDRGWKGYIKHADIHLRIRILIAEAGRELRTATETIEDGKVANSMVPVLLKWFSGAPPSPGGRPEVAMSTSEQLIVCVTL
jgi:hypothetical protein